MKSFNWTSFTQKIPVRVNIETMYDAWTKAEEIEKWFVKHSKYFDLYKILIPTDANIKKDFTYEWTWYAYDDIEHGKFTEANGKDHIQFTFAGECFVDINLKEEKEYTIVELTQSNIPTDEKSKQSIRLGCASGWAFFLVNLKSVYESGHDLRNKNHDLKGMLNN